MEINSHFYAATDFPEGRSLWYPLDRQLGGTEYDGEERKYLSLVEVEPLSYRNHIA
jgi:hypothetical protein